MADINHTAHSLDDTIPFPHARIQQHGENLSQKQKKQLPSFLNHFGSRELKIFFRCWAAAWASSLLIFINPTLDTIGTATFFACLVMLFLPPNGVIMVQILGALSLFLGMCLAWGWGVIAMKASHAIRPAAETAAKVLSLQHAAGQLAQNEGLSATEAAKHIIFSGHMLDARVVAINYCMLSVFIYFMARLRAANPKTTLTAVFGIIVSDLFIIYGPLLPSFSGTLPLSLVKPAAIGVGIGLACSVLFFPQSTSHIVLNGISDVIELLMSPLIFTALSLGKPGSEFDVAQLQVAQKQVVLEYKKLEPSMTFLGLEFSMGYWGAQDVQSLKKPLTQLTARILLLLEFHLGRVHAQTRSDEILRKHRGNPQQAREEKRSIGDHQEVQMAELLIRLHQRSEEQEEPLRPETIQALVQIGGKAVNACLEALVVVKECIHLVNARRWFNRPSSFDRESLVERTKTTLHALHQARASVIQDSLQVLMQEERRLRSLDKSGLQRNAGSLIQLMVFNEHLTSTIDSAENILSHISKLLSHATHIRLWSPFSIGYAASWVLRADTKAPGTESTESCAPEKGPIATPLTDRAQREVREKLGYRPKRKGVFAQTVLEVYHWFTCSEGLYALRMVIITIALSIPQLVPHSAGFYYQQRGLWGLMMGQTGLLVYMADFTFSVITRVVGTVLGGVLGLAAWYIGSGGGDGNPYGLAAVMAVMLVFFIWLRLYLPPHMVQGGIMSGATFLLVVAYSYDDTHIPSYGNPGVGYNVFWRRLLLVLCGVAAATIVQVLPRPPSATRHVCKNLSSSLWTIADHYALLLSCWGQSENNGALLAESFTLQLTQSLIELDPAINLLRYEFSSSPFDSTTLLAVQSLCHGLNLNLGRLLMLATSLPREYHSLLAQQTGIHDPCAIGDVMAVLTNCQQALKSGDSLPEILPTPLVRRAQHYQSQDSNSITEEMLRDEDYRKYCVALSAYLKFLWCVDELTLIIKGAVGESHIVWHKLADIA